MGKILLRVLSASARTVSAGSGHPRTLKYSRNEAIMYAALPGVELVMGGVIILEPAAKICQTRPPRTMRGRQTVVVEG